MATRTNGNGGNGSAPEVESDSARLLSMVETLAKSGRGGSDDVQSAALDAIGLLIERSPHRAAEQPNDREVFGHLVENGAAAGA